MDLFIFLANMWMSLNVGGCEYYLPTENWVADERKRSKTAVLDAAETGRDPVHWL